jgi:D-proline reductase (dithiol) PrdB
VDAHSQAASPPVDYIAATRAIYDAEGYPPYRWVHNEEPPPWTPVAVPLEEASVVLIASGGIYEVGQRAFHHKDDVSYRVIDADVPTDRLRATHFAYDLRDARSDPNVVFPIDTLRGLVAEGRGGIYSSRRVEEGLAPALVERVRDLEVDLALLVPV